MQDACCEIECKRRRRRVALDCLPLLAIVMLFGGCSRPAATAVPEIRLVPPDSSEAAFIEVTGIAPADQRSLTSAQKTMEEWQRVLAVSVKIDSSSAMPVPIAGKYTIHNGALRFTPLFPFDPGREYDVRFGSLAATVALPARSPTAPTFVTQTYPSADIVPENQLRMYIHFSAPMGRRGGVDRVTLLDDGGREVEMPFLPLDAEFWNADRTRYTVFFDPGRQKRGILPNRELGASLVEGRSYTLVVDRSWTDGNGQSLRESFTKRFRVGAPQIAPLEPAKWHLAAPAADTRQPLVVSFPQPLDHGLLLTAIGVRRHGRPVVGEVRVENHETRWTLIPAAEWSAGSYELTVLPILEDLAGNRIGRAFEVDGFERAAPLASDSRPISLPFAVSERR